MLGRQKVLSKCLYCFVQLYTGCEILAKFLVLSLTFLISKMGIVIAFNKLDYCELNVIILEKYLAKRLAGSKSLLLIC